MNYLTGRKKKEKKCYTLYYFLKGAFPLAAAAAAAEPEMAKNRGYKPPPIRAYI